MQKNYSLTYTKAIPGQLEGFGSPAVRTLKNSALDVLWSNTIGIPATVDNSTVYSVTFVGGAVTSAITASFTSGGSATQAALGAGLLAAIRASNIYRYAIPTLASNTITLQARSAAVNYTIASPTNAATTNDLTIGSQTAFAQSTDIDFGRFVVRSTSGTIDAPNEARLPLTASNISVAGVTLAPRAAVEKNAIGPTAKSLYYKNEAMDVVVRTNDAIGVWVECENNIVSNTALYIDCTTSGAYGRLTATTTTNLAVPSGISLVELPTATAIPGIYVCCVALNLP